MDPERIVHKSELTYTIRDGFSVSPGHTLIVAIRHVCSFFEMSSDERVELLDALYAAKVEIEQLRISFYGASICALSR